MSGPYDQSPSSPFKHRNFYPGISRKFRSPFPSPRNGNPGFSPINKSFVQRNQPRHDNRNIFYQNGNIKFHSPSGGRGGGHFRGGGPHRGSPREADISLYVNPSMLSDPWNDLTKLLQPRLKKSTEEKSAESADTTPNDSQNSINTSVSNDEVTEQVTEDSLITSDTSGNISDQTVEESAMTK